MSKTPWRFIAFLLALALYVALHRAEREAKCPTCFARAGREWRGMVGRCKRCKTAFRV